MERPFQGGSLSTAAAFVMCGLLLCVVSASAGHEVFDATGFSRNRPFVSQLPYEHVDPLNGNLVLVYTDLSLPGNAGFDLKLQRTYNSKIFADDTFGPLSTNSWAGVGWSFHLGRVRTSATDVPLAVEMPDGASHKLFGLYVGGTSKYVTRDYWIYDRDVNPPKLRLTNGIVYTFDKVVSMGGTSYRYATRIEDPFGNRIDITYAAVSGAPDAIGTITQFLGPPGNPALQTRQVTFTTETVSGRTRLKTMVYSGRTWTYSYDPANDGSRSLLKTVQPPVGQPWRFAYDTTGAVKNELLKVTTPYGGTIDYTYGTQGAGPGALASPFYLGSSIPVRSRVVTTRVTGGRDVSPGTQTYKYAQGAARNQTIMEAPAACTASPSKTTYTFLGVGNDYQTGAVWNIGLLSARKVEEGATVLENESVGWRLPNPNGNDRISTATETIGNNADFGIYAPVVEARTITRGGVVYSTTNTYISQPYQAGGRNFNDYGRPHTIAEIGDPGMTRTTLRQFAYGFTPYIVDRVLDETVTVGTESFRRSWVYTPTNGFRTDEYGWGSTFTNGIRTQYTPTSVGNVGSVIDGNGNATFFTYDWGVQQNVRTPAYPGVDTLRRAINPDGTVQSVTRRLDENGGLGYTTSYIYDSVFRVKQVTPAAGNATGWDYDDASSAGSQFTRVTRGASFVTTLLDGFGRPSGTANAVGVRTESSFDACGRKSYESLPFDNQHPQDSSGTRWTHDGLGRVTNRTNPGTPASSVSYRYTGSGLTGIDVEISDEENRRTRQEWVAFGDPDEPRLAAVTLDVGGTLQQATSYSYNALGSLTGVSGTGSPTRNLSYTVRNEVFTETHPESGLVTNTYDAAGNLATRQDANQAAVGPSTKTFFRYDANNRLTCIDQPPASLPLCDTSAPYDVAIGYDRADNRTSLVNIFLGSTFAFDGADRLVKRTDATGADTFVTDYTWDGNDNLQTIDYPRTGGTPRRTITNEYDAGNRVTKVREGATAYAHTFQYHPSGGAEQFTAGNGLVHRMSFDGRHRISEVKDGPGTSASVLDLTYSYDRVGNVTGLGHSQPPFGQQTLAVDHLDRLTSASGTLGGSFGYSAVGNMTSKDGVTLAYDGGTNRLSSTSGSPGTRYCYDLNGNIRSTGPSTASCPLSEAVYTYTPGNMLERATVGGVATTYRYDGDQLRVRKVQGAGPTVSHFIHGRQGQLLSEFSSPCFGEVSLPVRDYVYVNGRLLTTIRPSGVTPRAVGFSTAVSTTGEAGGAVTLNVNLTGTPNSCPVSVTYATANGTAAAGSDYTATSGTLNFPSGVTQLPISVPLINDTLDEDDETFSMTLSNAGGALLGSFLHVATIADEDPPPTLSIGDVTVTEGDTGSLNAGFSVTLSAASGRTVSVTYATADETATAGVDYVAATGSLTFLPGGPISQTLNVGVVGDLSDEPNQTFFVNLTSPVNATLADAQAVGTILDNDPPPTISIGDLAIFEHNDRSPRMRFAFTLSAPSDFPVSVTYATSDITATAGLDYTPASGTVTFAPGTSAGMTVIGDLNPDLQPEPNETFQVDLSDPVNSSIGDGLAIGTILDDEETDFFTLTPCRFVDTQGGAALTADSTRLFPAAGSTCGIPAGAKALAVSLTVVNPTAPGYLILFPAHSDQPLSTSITFNAGGLRSNNAIAVLGGGGQLAVYTGMASGSTHLIIDVFGYFE